MARIRKKLGVGIIGAAILSLALTACGGGSSDSGGGGGSGDQAIDTSNASGEISYWLWDANQLPAYQQCADDFHAKNPNITVKITQAAWDDYWTKLTNGFVGGTAPDVFTDHLSKYPEFVSQEQLVPLDATLQKDGIDTSIYQQGLADLWVGQDGKRYGLPKDFDTVSVFYNKKLIDDAGIKESDLQNMTWNPDDGGTYEKIIAHLTIDKNGKRGDEPGFDKTKVKVYGLGLDGGSGGGNGQTQWSMYTGTLPWQFTDKNPWGTHYNYDNADFQKTMGWMRSLIDKGYMPSVEAVTGQSSADIFGAGKYAMVTNGSWMIGQMYSYKGIETATAPTPVGPSGKRSSMYNGLADSIWVGSKNKPAAAKWVEYLGSAACQDVVGEKGVVFPAVKTSTDKAQAAFKAKNIDVNSFLIQVKDGTTFLFPITDHASEIQGIMNPAMDAVWTGKAQPSSLTDANNQVNALFG
ncbi:MAG TPA: sugar ABC transporter substrate-binding protein [Microlunatus sp.]|nr:sugar ABC transporter substrate-binding protein [Microlunatus sp.]